MADLFVNYIQQYQWQVQGELEFIEDNDNCDDLSDEDKLLDYEELDDDMDPNELPRNRDPDYYCHSTDERRPLIRVPLAKKMKAVNSHREHKNWKLKTLQVHIGKCLIRIDELYRWKQQITKGGCPDDQLEVVSNWVYERFREQRAAQLPVTTRNLQEWALQAAAQFCSTNFKFKASLSWINDFKKKFRICRKVSKFVKPTERRSLNESMAASSAFQLDGQSLTIDPKKIVNTEWGISIKSVRGQFNVSKVTCARADQAEPCVGSVCWLQYLRQ
ncbi:hypothetical protein QAD02_024441 [Eretmocerus hayati]|uniref:Uncharacterized protein n=1 Tax=Eretmocerus hayati TaxID=131215 RepID=A0ACC2Q0X4_9HYME|nr:hypothetical protein QAD02_024441 [Eretmocerus hayati]